MLMHALLATVSASGAIKDLRWRYLSVCRSFGFSSAQTRKEEEENRVQQIRCWCSGRLLPVLVRYVGLSAAQQSKTTKISYKVRWLLPEAPNCFRLSHYVSVSTAPPFDWCELCVSEQIGENEGDSGGADSPPQLRSSH